MGTAGGPWWGGLAVRWERRLTELLLDRRALRGALVGKDDDGSAIFVSGTVPFPSPWRIGHAVAVYAVQERPRDPSRKTVRCAAEVVHVSDLGDGRVRVIARAHDAERDALDRQNWRLGSHFAHG